MTDNVIKFRPQAFKQEWRAVVENVSHINGGLILTLQTAQYCASETHVLFDSVRKNTVFKDKDPEIGAGVIFSLEAEPSDGHVGIYSVSSIRRTPLSLG